MGWDITALSRDALIQQLIAPHESNLCRHTTIAHSLQGDELWIVTRNDYKPEYRPTEKIRTSTFIKVVIFEGAPNGRTAYKCMTEIEHPYFYKCPMDFLNLAPVANHEWRRIVISRHNNGGSHV